jgi:hypothetical protein
VPEHDDGELRRAARQLIEFYGPRAAEVADRRSANRRLASVELVAP